MAEPLRIGMIGLDTSHCTAFATLLHDEKHAYHVPGGRIVTAYRGGSADFPMSYNRVDKFTTTLQEEHAVQLVESPEEVVKSSDAILLTSVDGRVHLEQFRQIVSYGKPVFIDKPFAVSSADARQMVELARRHHVPLMSSSSLRFSAGLQETLKRETGGAIIGADCYGPMELQPTQPGLFWYGIHATEMLYAILGVGCHSVLSVTHEDHEFVVGQWADGRIGTIRGNRKGNKRNGALIHREEETHYVDVLAHPKPKYAGLLEVVMAMFQTGIAQIAVEETLEIIRFLEAANESRTTGKPVML